MPSGCRPSTFAISSVPAFDLLVAKRVAESQSSLRITGDILYAGGGRRPSRSSDAVSVCTPSVVFQPRPRPRRSRDSFDSSAVSTSSSSSSPFKNFLYTVPRLSCACSDETSYASMTRATSFWLSFVTPCSLANLAIAAGSAARRLFSRASPIFRPAAPPRPTEMSVPTRPICGVMNHAASAVSATAPFEVAFTTGSGRVERTFCSVESSS
mmetsp:Transcript_1731/g.3628  ORF Transcript_1731/g.3628 Transcript_1731/m.3628 type:complete len:211 (-) Transcript_1731:322-954(-)